MGYHTGFQRSVMSPTLARDEYSDSTIPKVIETSGTCCSPSNHVVVMSRSRNPDTGEEAESRGVRRQKYPLDDYLISNASTPTRVQASLLSPISPVSSPETVDVLQNAERLVKNAQKQIMEVSFNSALNTLDENLSSYMGRQPLDESLLYIREMVDSKFQDSNDPSKKYFRKTSPDNLASSNRKDDLFPVKDSTGMLNKPLEISQQNSEFSARQTARGIFLENDKPFFKKAPNWFNVKPPEHIDVFPISTTGNLKAKTKSTCTVPCCTMTNTGVIEISGRDHVNGSIQVQTGPTVDIRRELTIQTIENVHISPDPSSVPVYNNIATYCFQHEPSRTTSFAESNKSYAAKNSARNLFDARKERHIQSTDYNDTQKTMHIENTNNADTTVIKNSSHLSHDMNQDTIGTQTMLNDNSNNHKRSNNDNVNCSEVDFGSVGIKESSDNNPVERSKLRESSIVNDNLHAQKTLQEPVDNGVESTQPKKTVGINLTPIVTSVYQELPIMGAEVEFGSKEEDLDEDMEFASSYGGYKFHHVQSDKQYVQRSHVCGDECKTSSCSRKCERDVEHREKQRLKEALETIANIQKLRFDIKDTGVIPAECTQICEDRNGCNADMVTFELQPFSEPERFKTALEKLCKSSQNNRVSKIDTNSKAYQAGIEAFVKMVFDSNSQSDSVHGIHTSGQCLEVKEKEQSTEGTSLVETTADETQKEEIPKPLTQVKLTPEIKESKYRQPPSRTVNPKNNNITVKNLSSAKNNTSSSPIRQLDTGQSKEPNKYFKPSAPQNNQLPKNKITQQDKTPSKMPPNKEKNSLQNFDLKQPCISDVDAVLKTFRESMAAICQGTEQLSQLISHHIMKNVSSTSDQISSSPIPNCPINLGKINVKAHNISDLNIPAKPVSNLVSHGLSKVLGQSVSVRQKNSTDQSTIEETVLNRLQSIEKIQQKLVHGRIPRHDNPSGSRNYATFSNENNSVSTNETRVSTVNELSSMCSRSPSEQVETSSCTNEKPIPAQFDGANDNTSHSQSTSKVSEQTPVDIKTQSVSKQQRDVKGLCKPGGNQFMNVQCCIPEPRETPIPIEVTSDKKNCSSQSDLRSPLSTYLHLENACGRDVISTKHGGKDIRLRRHSNYDIRNEQTGDLSLYKCPVLISGDNFDASDNDSNDKLTPAERVVQTKEIEHQVFGQVLDAVQNSSQFMQRIIVSLFNGMEVESINDIVKNLEDAALHPIVIEQFLVILKERNKDKSLFGGNLMLKNLEPVSDVLQKNYNEPRDLPNTRVNMNTFEHSTGFNGTMETTNIHIIEGVEDPSVLHPGGDEKTQSSDSTQNEVNLNLEIKKECAQSIHNRNNTGDRAPENTSPSHEIKCEIIHEKHAAAEELKDSGADLIMPKTTFENKSRLSEPSLILSGSIFQAPASEDVVEKKPEQDCREVKEKSLGVEHYQHNIAASKGQSNMTECSSDSTSSNATPKKNDSESNTDKDISFLIPHDTDGNNEVVDLSSAQKLTSVTLKNETTGEIIGIQIESNCQNCLRLNSHSPERRTKMKSNPGSTESSSATNRSSGKLQNSNYPALKNTNLIQELRTDDRSIICHCQRPKDPNASNIESHYVPFGSTMDTMNALIDLQIQNNYKQLGLINSEERSFPSTPNKTTTIHRKPLNKRPSPSKLSATSKSPIRKADNSSKPGSNKKKSLDKKVIGSKRVFRDNKQGSMKATKNTGITDLAKSNVKNSCLLCIQLEGNCSCSVGTDSIANLKKHKKMSPKSKKDKAKLVKNIVSPRQTGIPKHSGSSGDKNSSRKELNPISKALPFSSTTAPLESGKNVDSRNMDYSHRIVKNNEKLNSARTAKDAAYKGPKSKLKPSSGRLSSNSSSNNDGSMNRKAKPAKDEKLFQDAASDSDNLKVEDKSQCTAKTAAVTVCKSIETQNTVISGDNTVCRNTETLCKKLSIVDQITRLLPIKPDYFAGINRNDKPAVKEAVTLKCFESCSLMQNSFADHRNTCLDRTNVTKETITECTKQMRDFTTMGCQTEMHSTLQQCQPNPPETVCVTETVSVFKTNRPNIFDDESIIVLQPLNGLDHTFVISKPNCVERKIIQEKLNKRFTVQVGETTDHICPSVDELNQHDEESNNELTYPNGEPVEQVNFADKGTSKDSIELHNTTSTISCLRNKECQAGCPGGIETEDPINNKQSVVSFAPMHVTDSNESISENKEECGAGRCENNEECLRICLQPPIQLDDLKSSCKNDCPHEEICLTICPSVSQAEPLQTSSININGILQKFIAENNVLDVKLPMVKGLLKELKKVEDSLRGENEKLETIFEKSEPQSDSNKAECIEPRCSVEESPQRSIKYEEPREKLKGIMSNRKSLVLSNVVREIADMHPSTKLEHLKLRSADPLVSGNFNKSESDRRYSVFNQANPESSTINLKDPKTQAHLATIAQRATGQDEKGSSSDSSIDIAPTIFTEMIKNTPAARKSNSGTASKLNKSRRGMDADSNPLIGFNAISAERDNGSMKSFESYDLEPGEFLQVRTPFDNPIMSRQFSGRTDLEIGEVLQDQAKWNGLCNKNKNHSQSVKNAGGINTEVITTNQYQTLENKYELCMDSPEAVYMRKKHNGHSDKFVGQSDSVSPDIMKCSVNGSQEIFGKNDQQLLVSNHHSVLDKEEHLGYVTADDSQFNNQSTNKIKTDKNAKAKNVIIIGESSFTDVNSNTSKVIERLTGTDPQYSKMNISSEIDRHPHRLVNESQNIDYFQKYSERISSDTEFSNRPQIIDHFLGKRRLEDLKIEYTNNKADTVSKECQSLSSNCQRLYLKSDSTLKTTPDSASSNIMDSPDLFTTRNNAVQFNFNSRTYNKLDLANSNQTTCKHWDQTSSDTYSEGEINLPSSCSYSLGEVKISTPSSTTAGKSFKDSDGLTIFVTKSILDSTYATCNSPGEILTDIQKTETDFSSSIS